MATMKQTYNIEDEKKIVVALVLRAQQGDREAFGDLFERYERHVFAVAMRRLGDFAEAQELCQDVFIQAMQKIAQLRQPDCFGGWLRQITHRMAINRMVRRGPVHSAEPESLAAACAEPSTPLDSALEMERQTHVRAGLDQLRDLDRETLLAFYVKGQSLIEMSDEFDAPIGTIKRRLHVARKRLAKHVEELVAV